MSSGALVCVNHFFFHIHYLIIRMNCNKFESDYVSTSNLFKFYGRGDVQWFQINPNHCQQNSQASHLACRRQIWELV